MKELEQWLIETVSYAVDFRETVLFCRLCGHISTDADDVKYRRCSNCKVFHDNVTLERWLQQQKKV